MKGIPLWPVGKGLGVCSKGVLKQPQNRGFPQRFLVVHFVGCLLPQVQHGVKKAVKEGLAEMEVGSTHAVG